MRLIRHQMMACSRHLCQAILSLYHVLNAITLDYALTFSYPVDIFHSVQIFR